jgi:hypothetical protein
MGTSNWQNISYCIDLIRRMNPESVLDVGAGFGRWGMICREFLDVWNGRVEKKSWVTRVEGIEAFPLNIDEYHQYFYNKVWNVDARDFFKEINEKYDLVIFGDVLEHFYKDEANMLLKRALNFSDYVMINIPLGDNWEQHDLYGNEYEEHKSVWYEDDFDAYPILRKRLFKDYIGRPFITIILSKQRTAPSELMNPMNLDNEILQIEQDIHDSHKYYLSLKDEREASQLKFEQLFKKGELKILNAAEKEKTLIKIQLDDLKNLNSQGTEVWIRHISTEMISAIDLNAVKKDENWITKTSENTPTGYCLIASQNGAELEFEVVGETLHLKCLSHAWSGKFNVWKNDTQILNVDLYSKNQKNIDVIINIKGVD